MNSCDGLLEDQDISGIGEAAHDPYFSGLELTVVIGVGVTFYAQSFLIGTQGPLGVELISMLIVASSSGRVAAKQGRHWCVKIFAATFSCGVLSIDRSRISALLGFFWTLTITTLALLISAIIEAAQHNLSLYNAILVSFLSYLHDDGPAAIFLL